MDAERIHSTCKVVANQLGYTNVKAEQERVVIREKFVLWLLTWTF